MPEYLYGQPATPPSSKDSINIKGWNIPPINLNNPVDWAVALLQENNRSIASLFTGWLARNVMLILGAALGSQAAVLTDTVYKTIFAIVSGLFIVVPIGLSYINKNNKVKVQNAAVAVITAIELAKQANNGVIDFNDPQIKDMLSTIMQDDGKNLVNAVQMYTAYIQTHSKIKPIAPFTSNNKDI